VAQDTPDGLARQMKGAERCRARGGRPREDAVTEKLQSVGGVLAVQVEGGDNGKAGQYTVECQAGLRPAAELASLVVSQGWGLARAPRHLHEPRDVFITWLPRVRRDSPSPIRRS